MAFNVYGVATSLPLPPPLSPDYQAPVPPLPLVMKVPIEAAITPLCMLAVLAVTGVYPFAIGVGIVAVAAATTGRLRSPAPCSKWGGRPDENTVAMLDRIRVAHSSSH